MGYGRPDVYKVTWDATEPPRSTLEVLVLVYVYGVGCRITLSYLDTCNVLVSSLMAGSIGMTQKVREYTNSPQLLN